LQRYKKKGHKLKPRPDDDVQKAPVSVSRNTFIYRPLSWLMIYFMYEKKGVSLFDIKSSNTTL